MDIRFEWLYPAFFIGVSISPRDGIYAVGFGLFSLYKATTLWDEAWVEAAKKYSEDYHNG